MGYEDDDVDDRDGNNSKSGSSNESSDSEEYDETLFLAYQNSINKGNPESSSRYSQSAQLANIGGRASSATTGRNSISQPQGQAGFRRPTLSSINHSNRSSTTSQRYGGQIGRTGTGGSNAGLLQTGPRRASMVANMSLVPMALRRLNSRVNYDNPPPGGASGSAGVASPSVPSIAALPQSQPPSTGGHGRRESMRSQMMRRVSNSSTTTPGAGSGRSGSITSFGVGGQGARASIITATSTFASSVGYMPDGDEDTLLSDGATSPVNEKRLALSRSDEAAERRKSMIAQGIQNSVCINMIAFVMRVVLQFQFGDYESLGDEDV
ncbi:hypothetical protein HDU76_012648 [Blyttiomyces sp. JEL0837]|nr:hypothetical protein HDU76_012648 [Blyttiomyces sp. JEL0837]